MRRMILGQCIRSYRTQNRIGVRKLAKTIGIPHYTLFRFENEELVEADSFLKILLWILTHA